MGRNLKISSTNAGKKLGILAARGVVTKYKRGVWRTNISHKDEPVPVPKKQKHWWKF